MSAGSTSKSWTSVEGKQPVYIEHHKGGLMDLVDFEGTVKQTGFYSFTRMIEWAKRNGCIIMKKPEEETS